jgi:type IV secretory pathway TrbD component
MSNKPKMKAMNLNSLLMGADHHITAKSGVSPSSPPSLVKPPTMRSLGNLEKDNKKVQEPTANESIPKNKIATSLNKLFEKAEANQKVIEDTNAKTKSSGFGKMSKDMKRAKTTKAIGARPASAFGKKVSGLDSDDSRSESDSSQTESGSGSESKSSDDMPPPPSFNNNGGNVPLVNNLVVSDSDSDSDLDMPQHIGFNKATSVAINKSNPMMSFQMPLKKSKEKSEKGIEKLLDKPHQKHMNTPAVRRRKVLVTNSSGANQSINNMHGFQALDKLNEKRGLAPKKEDAKPKSSVMPNLSLNLLSKQTSVQMTPSETFDNSRKLLQMKTVGTDSPFAQKRSKDDIDLKTKFNYVNHLKEDPEGVKVWSKSFGDAINVVTVVNKEYLAKVDPKVQKMFMKNDSLRRKTVVFGLDGVLVKTSFEKEGPEWKPSDLILDRDKNLKMKIYVAVRPFVINTLKQLKRAGMEVILYSSSQYNYTTAILNILLKQRVDFHHIISSEDHEKACE